MYKVRLFDEGWSAKYWSNQWNTWFPCQDLVVGNIPNTKERSHQPTSDCNALCSSKQGVKYSVLLFICFNCLKISLLFYVCLHFCICVCVLCARLVPKAARRGCQIPRNWSDRRLWAAMWMLATTQSAARRAAGTLADELLSSLIWSYFIKRKWTKTWWQAPRRHTCLSFLCTCVGWGWGAYACRDQYQTSSSTAPTYVLRHGPPLTWS